ncbi:LysR family transcriptional regulator [Actinomadura violacea]|uniref:LysR family transcriptional regulator n=1 Tax=Actinomadura violacea TaxID=2819934 RepID=A0ABS3RVF9_9ACTN|nr:LysR family transcriptional regulator [Actinomadura violacea]MBO2460751.1 LysR family transcriptional regulator [Actinomadura violacea]
MDVSVRSLRYFVAVAEELHFTRAAERLRIAQPALSKAVRRMEQEMGVTLFERSRQGVALTGAGRSLLPVARGVLGDLDSWLAGVRRARDAASRVLRVEYHSGMDGETIEPVIARFARLRPGWRADLRVGDWRDPAGGVLEGRVHAAFIPLPVPGQENLDVEVLRREPRRVALHAGHPLAARDTVRLDDLRDERFVALPASSGPLREFWLAAAEFGRTPAIGAEVANSEDWLQAVQSGRGVAMITESSARVYARPGIVYRPVEGVAPAVRAVVWRRDATDPVLRDFVRACVEAADRPRDEPAEAG